MLKILIADDEKNIRETIASLIDWNSLDLKLIGCARNGLEAYNMILDEYPEIVLTDIKMPILSGLDLIEKIYTLNKNTQFVILSGHNEFEYARKAMQFGVKHYLLKPCNENQIIRSLKEAADDYYALYAASPSFLPSSPLNTQFQNNLMINLINKGLTSFSSEPDTFWAELKDKSQSFSFPSSSHEVCCLYFLEEQNQEQAAQDIISYRNQNFPALQFYILYVKNTCIFFFDSTRINYEQLDAFFSSLSYPNQSTEVVYERKTYDSFSSALYEIIRRIRNYEVIYYTNDTDFITINNHNNLIHDVLKYIDELYQSPPENINDVFSLLCDLLTGITNAAFLKQIASSVIITSVSRHPSFTAVSAAELLIHINESENCQEICGLLIQQLNSLIKERTSGNFTGTLSKKIQQYVEENLSACDLSLKWIAENYLYMNVDYVSKKFFKETGQKFSKYLTDIRIQKAKELLSCTEADKIQNIARQIGLENNPQYFSQIFKKNTGMTPSQYMKIMQGTRES